MGKREKKNKHQNRGSRTSYYTHQEDEEENYEQYNTYSSSEKQLLPPSDDFEDDDDEGEGKTDLQLLSDDMPSKFHLYQQSVQVLLLAFTFSLDCCVCLYS